MNVRVDCNKLGNIPCQTKSFRPAWLRENDVQRRDGEYFEDVDGYHLLAVYILFEAVMAAAQEEDIALAEECKAWLRSNAALPFFEECNLNHERVDAWIQAHCPIPYLGLDFILR